jgi:phospho-N-acetylmuramoyl-pentapeptide-transferase
VLIKVLSRRGIGQVIRSDGPTTHQVKQGTPTMGGVAIIFAATAGYLLSHLVIAVPVTTSALLVLALVFGIGFVGFLDDWLKISRQNSKGLSAKLKLIGQALVAIGFAVAGRYFPDERGLTPISDQLSTVRDTAISLTPILVILLDRSGPLRPPPPEAAGSASPAGEAIAAPAAAGAPPPAATPAPETGAGPLPVG